MVLKKVCIKAPKVWRADPGCANSSILVEHERFSIYGHDSGVRERGWVTQCVIQVGFHISELT